jgi:hypothetical protein
MKIKTVARVPFAFYWYIKNCMLSFFSKKNGEYSQVITDLCENGYVIIGRSYGDLSFNQISTAIRNIVDTESLAVSGQSNGRVINIHLKDKAVARYVEHVRTIAAEYFSDKNIKVEMTLYQHSKREDSLGDVPGGEAFHIDDGRKTLKFFLYLTDVGEDNGPFCYAPKSHGLTGWLKFFRIIEWFITTRHFSLYFMNENKIINKYGQVRVCLNAGTLFCADTTGFHRATPVMKGEREVFVVSFNEKRFDII